MGVGAQGCPLFLPGPGEDSLPSPQASPHLQGADPALACQPQASLVTFLLPCLVHPEP